MRPLEQHNLFRKNRRTVRCVEASVIACSKYQSANIVGHRHRTVWCWLHGRGLWQALLGHLCLKDTSGWNVFAKNWEHSTQTRNQTGCTWPTAPGCRRCGQSAFCQGKPGVMWLASSYGRNQPGWWEEYGEIQWNVVNARQLPLLLPDQKSSHLLTQWWQPGTASNTVRTNKVVLCTSLHIFVPLLALGSSPSSGFVCQVLPRKCGEASSCKGRYAPPESTKYTQGKLFSMAICCALKCFFTVMG